MLLALPKKYSDGNIIHHHIHLQDPKKNVYIIGGNGSGKSRLGIYIEENLKGQGVKVLRIAAQKVLSIPLETFIRSVEAVDIELQQPHTRLVNFNTTHIQNHVTSITNDFTQVLIKLFSLKSERDAKFVEQFQQNVPQSGVIITPIETINIIWREIFPHRRLIFGNGKIEAEYDSNGITVRYSANEMSDGERGALYLLAHALTASSNSVLIYDEPESHLHRSLLNRVWNLLEQHASDKKIIVITHDLDLVASRKNAFKLWIKEYGGGYNWDWELIEEGENDIPEDLLLELLELFWFDLQ